MLRSIGLTAQHALPELWVTEAELAAARTSLEVRGWKRGTPVIGVQPGANDPYIREWGAERYATSSEILAREMGASVILMGGKDERQTSERMASFMKAPPINLVGELPLRAALCTIGLCQLWLGNDTGLLHCAVAQRVASVGIFGPNKAVRWGYDSPRHRSLVSFPRAPAKDDQAVRQSLDAIPVSEMLDTARAVLSAPNSGLLDAAGAYSVATGAVVRAPYFAATLNTASVGPVRRR
jgi:ADP-heptose:LPS heptosyltransferase